VVCVLLQLAFARAIRKSSLPQIESSSEDAADEDDDDFEPMQGTKRKTAKAPKPRNCVQPLQSKPGTASQVTSASIKFTNCVINPKTLNMSHRTLQFLSRICPSLLETYEFASHEVQYCKAGHFTISDGGIIFSKRTGRNHSLPYEFGYDDISSIQTCSGDGETRHFCFQTQEGLIFTLDIECAMGDYSRFRT
jgi:hypothetical protein